MQFFTMQDGGLWRWSGATMQIFNPASGGSWEPSQFHTPSELLGVVGMFEISGAEATQIRTNAVPQFALPNGM